MSDFALTAADAVRIMDHSQLSRHPREASTKVAPETLRNLRGIPTDPITSRSSSLQFFRHLGHVKVPGYDD